MPWPLSQDYNEAIQNPQSSFADPELRGGQVVVNALGLPLPRSGNFADVYEFQGASGARWAIKCFTRQIPGLRERYREISSYLNQLSKRVRLSFMVDFTFLDQGIRIRGDWYPILKMQWVEGYAFNEFIKSFLDNRETLETLCQRWVQVAKLLRQANLGHCDLQHGNVLLAPGSMPGSFSVKLVDYDGMCVPSLTLLKSIELGHSAYQHPERLREGIYSLEVDRFSNLVIYTALRSLVVGGRPLWERYDNGDNLLFRQEDFQAPARSALIQELLQSHDQEVRRLAATVAWAAQQPLVRTPFLGALVPDERPPRVAVPATRVPARAVAVGSPPSTWSQATASPPVRVLMPWRESSPPSASAEAATFEASADPLTTTAPSLAVQEYEQAGKPRWPLWAALGVVMGLVGLAVLVAWILTRPTGPSRDKNDHGSTKDGERVADGVNRNVAPDNAGGGGKAEPAAPPKRRVIDEEEEPKKPPAKDGGGDKPQLAKPADSGQPKTEAKRDNKEPPQAKKPLQPDPEPTRDKNDSGEKKDEKIVTTKSGLKYIYIDLKVGTGKEVKAGDTITVHYAGTLKDGTKIDSSVDRKVPFSFQFGKGKVIKGWDEGIAGMKEGGKRKLIIPPELGYGRYGFLKIPPNAELQYEIDLLKVGPPPVDAKPAPGQNNGVGPKGKPTPKKPEAPANGEEEATKKLHTAKSLLEDSNRARFPRSATEADRPNDPDDADKLEKRARKLLGEIIEKWPDTKAAAKAQDILDGKDT